MEYESSLYHHGVKGMKWGVRKYQQKDGSLTSAGKKRYSDAAQAREQKTQARDKARQEKIRKEKEDIQRMIDALDQHMQAQKASIFRPLQLPR